MPRLGQSTLTSEERTDEARRILATIKVEDFSKLSARDQSFLDTQYTNADNVSYSPSPNQLFWLRDIKDKLI